MITRRLLNIVFVGLLLVGTAPACLGSIVLYDMNLDGPSEAPPNTSPGVGTGRVTFDLTAITMRIQLQFSGLTGNSTVAHIHAATEDRFTGTAGPATQTPTLLGFPAGVTSGSYDQLFDMTQTTSYSGAFLTANGGSATDAFNALVLASEEGKAYFNLHTSAFPGGEIRGFLTAVPEPSSALMLSMLATTTLLYRRRSV